MVRLLGVEGNGVFSFLYVNANIGVLIFGMNVRSAMVYYLAKGDFPREKIAGFVFLVLSFAMIIVAIIGGALFSTHSPALAIILPKGFQGIFFLCYFLLSFFAQAIIQFCSAYAVGNLLYRIFNQYTVVSAIAKVLLIGLFYAGSIIGFWEKNLYSLFVLFLGIEILFAAIFLIILQLRQAFKLSFQFSYSDFIKPFLIYSIKGWTMDLLSFFTNRFFNWVVTLYQGLKSLSFIALAISLLNNVELFFYPIYQALKPYLIKLDKAEGEQRFLFYFRLTNTIAIIFSVGALLLSDFFLPLIFGEEFQDAVVITQIIFFSMPFLTIRGMGRMYASAHNLHQFMVIAEAIGFGVTVVGDLIFIPSYGIIGASWVMLAAYLLTGSFVGFFLVKRMQVPVLGNLILKASDLKAIRNYLNDKKS